MKIFKILIILVTLFSAVRFIFSAFIYMVRLPNTQAACDAQKIASICAEAAESTEYWTGALANSFMWLVLTPLVYFIVIKMAKKSK